MVSLMFLSLSLFAAAKEKIDKDDNKNPLGCDDVGYSMHLKTLILLPGEAGPRNSMYFVYNLLPQSVNLFNMRHGDGLYSTYLNHSIQSHKWAVLETNEKSINYVCTVDDKNHPNYGKIVDCAGAVKVCEFTKVVFGMNNRGNYWMVKSNTRNGALREVVRYGIIPAY